MKTDASDWQRTESSQTCFMFASLELNTPDVLCWRSGDEYSPDCCTEQSGILPLKSADIILCALYVMVSIVHSCYVTSPTNNHMPSFVVLQNLCLFRLVHWKLWIASSRELNMNVRGTHFLQHYNVVWFICAFGINVRHWIKFIITLWNIVSIVCHLSYTAQLFLLFPFCCWGNKVLFFSSIICMLQMLLLLIICIHGIGCTAIDDSSFWNKKLLQINKCVNTAYLGTVTLYSSLHHSDNVETSSPIKLGCQRKSFLEIKYG